MKGSNQDTTSEAKTESNPPKKVPKIGDYRTLLLGLLYKKLDPNKILESLKAFYTVLTNKSLTDIDTNKISKDMFVKRLLPLIKPQTIWNVNKKLAIASFRCSMFNSNVSSSIDEKKDDTGTSITVVNDKYVSALRFDLNAEMIEALTEDIKIEVKGVYDKIAELKDDELSIDNVLTPMIKLEQEMSPIQNSVVFLQVCRYIFDRIYVFDIIYWNDILCAYILNIYSK